VSFLSVSIFFLNSQVVIQINTNALKLSYTLVDIDQCFRTQTSYAIRILNFLDAVQIINQHFIK